MTDTHILDSSIGCWTSWRPPGAITRDLLVENVAFYSHLWLCYLYATFCPPRFSIFFCLLLSASGAAAPSPAAPPIPPSIPFMPPTVVAARYAEYPGTTRYNHQALPPNTITSTMLIQVQYTMSHMNSVRPLASRSSPARRSEPSAA